MAITVFDEAAGSATTTSGPSWEIKIFYNYNLKHEICQKKSRTENSSNWNSHLCNSAKPRQFDEIFFQFFFKIGRTLPLPYLLRRRRIPKEHKRLIKQRPKTTIQTMTLIPNIEDDALLDNKNSPQSLPNPECHLHLLVLLEHIFHNRNRNNNNSNNIHQRNSR